MSRIRTIKPDAFKSESLSSVSRGARWTFAGLWTYVDDEGRGRAEPRLIKAELYPLDDGTTAADVDTDMSELIEAGCIHTYMSGGKVYIHVPEFRRHQRINRPTESVLPACSCQIHAPLSEDSVSTVNKTQGRGKGREGEREREGERASATRPPRKCPKHAGQANPPSCGACADARKESDAWQKPTHTPHTMCGDHPTHPALDCPVCAAEVAVASPSVMAQVKALAKRKTA